MKALEDLVAPLAKRLNSSIVSSFILSWTAINWKFIVTLPFASQPIKNRIEDAEGYLSNVAYSWLLPVLMTILYVMVLPLLDSFITKVNAGSAIRNNSTGNSIKKANILEEIEIARNEKILNDIRSGYAEVETLNQENANLRTLIEQKNSIIEENTKALELVKQESDRSISTMNADYGHLQGLYLDASAELSNLRERISQI